MIEFNVVPDIKRAVRFYRELDEVHANRATVNALNVLGRTVRNVSIDRIAAYRHIGKRKIRQNVTLQRAKIWDQRAIIRATGGPISLKDYGARQTPLGVTVNVEGTRKLVPGAFILDSLGGHVYERTGADRSKRGTRAPIHKMWGPSISTGFIKAEVERAQRQAMGRDWVRVLREKMNDQLAKLRARYGG